MRKLTLAGILGAAMLMGCPTKIEPKLAEVKIEQIVEKEVRQEKVEEKKIALNDYTKVMAEIEIWCGGYFIRIKTPKQNYVYGCAKHANYDSILIGDLMDNPGGGGMPDLNSEELIDFGRDGKVDAISLAYRAIERNKPGYGVVFEKADKIFKGYQELLKKTINIAEQRWELEQGE